MSDGATSEILDTLEALRDSFGYDAEFHARAVDALALFIERHGYADQAKVFLHRYFDGQESRTPHAVAPLVPRILTLEEAKADPTRMKEFNQVRIWSDEHHAWWGPKGSGYFTDIDSAGVYSINEAWCFTSHCCPKKKIQFHSAT